MFSSIYVLMDFSIHSFRHWKIKSLIHRFFIFFIRTFVDFLIYLLVDWVIQYECIDSLILRFGHLVIHFFIFYLFIFHLFLSFIRFSIFFMYWYMSYWFIWYFGSLTRRFIGLFVVYYSVVFENAKDKQKIERRLWFIIWCCSYTEWGIYRNPVTGFLLFVL